MHTVQIPTIFFPNYYHNVDSHPSGCIDNLLVSMGTLNGSLALIKPFVRPSAILILPYIHDDVSSAPFSLTFRIEWTAI